MTERFVPSEETLPGVYMPLLIMPSNALGRWDEDHVWFVSSDEHLQGPDKRPLRYSNLELIPRIDHEVKNSTWDAVVFPQTEKQYFQATLLGALNYIPSEIIDVSSSFPFVRPTTPQDRLYIRSNNLLRMQRGTKWSVGYYFARHILANGLDAVKDTNEVSKFLEASSEVEQARHCFSVIRKAAEVVLDDVEPLYEVARRQGSIRRQEPTALRFLMQHFDRRQPDYAPSICKELLTA